MRGILTSPLPETVRVKDKDLAVSVSWRTWIKITKVIESDKETEKIVQALFFLAFPDHKDMNYALKYPDEAVLALIGFLHRNKQDQGSKPLTSAQRRLSKVRLIDFDYDSDLIVADFQREYGIDLTNPEEEMHWFRFMALLNGLCDEAKIIEAIRVRASDLSDSKLSKEEKKLLREKKIHYALPARNREEAIQNAMLLRGANV